MTRVCVLIATIFALLAVPYTPGVAENSANKRLLDSIIDLNLQGVKTAIRGGASVNAPQGKSTFVFQAAMGAWSAKTPKKKNDLAEILRLLFENGARLTKQDETGLAILIAAGATKAVRVLLKNGASPLRPINGQSPIAIAEGANKTKIVELLVEAGAIQLSKSDVLQTQLVSAAAGWSIEAVRKTLSAGAKANKPASGNRYALLAALTIPMFDDDRVALIRLLLSHGADPNISGFVSKNYSGTVLTTLVSQSFLAKDKAVYRKGFFEILDLLIANGADIKQKDSFGQTVLHIAAERGFGFAVKKLVELGADTGALDGFGKLPYQYSKSKSVADLLKPGDPQAKAGLNRKNLDAGFEAYKADDYAKALRLLRPFASNGNSQAQMALGTIYYFGGKGVRRSYKDAAKWHLEAANLGEGIAQFQLGRMYAEGLGVKKDEVKAVKWLRRSAEQGSALAQVELGLMYQTGDGGLKKDGQVAINLFRMAAEQENEKARVLLGINLISGEGMSKNNVEAAKHLRQASDRGSALAQRFLGNLYSKGTGVPQSDTEAAKWYRKAADQGEVGAQALLGSAYFNGRGVAKDIILAYKWVNLAAAQGDQASKKARDAIGKTMSKGQLAEAQRLTRRWKRSSPRAKKTKNARKEKSSVAVKSSGTGFYISSDGHVLTNFHVIKACKKLSIRSPSGSSATATVVTKDRRGDLALLKTKSPPSSVAIFRAGASPRIGEQIVVYGFPLAGILASSGNLVTGTLSALAGVGNDPRHYQVTAPVQPGNSGGPLLDESGRVIGVIVSKLNAARVAKATGDIPQNVNFAIKGSTALGFVEAGGVEPVFQIKEDKQSPAAIAEKAQEFTVQVLCQK